MDSIKKSFEAYPVSMVGYRNGSSTTSYDKNEHDREVYRQGYEQAINDINTDNEKSKEEYWKALLIGNIVVGCIILVSVLACLMLK